MNCEHNILPKTEHLHTHKVKEWEKLVAGNLDSPKCTWEYSSNWLHLLCSLQNSYKVLNACTHSGININLNDQFN